MKSFLTQPLNPTGDFILLWPHISGHILNLHSSVQCVAQKSYIRIPVYAGYRVPVSCRVNSQGPVPTWNSKLQTTYLFLYKVKETMHCEIFEQNLTLFLPICDATQCQWVWGCLPTLVVFSPFLKCTDSFFLFHSTFVANVFSDTQINSENCSSLYWKISDSLKWILPTDICTIYARSKSYTDVNKILLRT